MSGTEAQLRGVRRRLTAVTAAVVAALLAVTGVGVVLAQRSQLRDAVDDALERRADELEVLVADALPVELGGAPDDDEWAAQLVAPDGRVLAATPNITGFGALGGDPGEDEVFGTVEMAIEDDETEPFRVLSERVDAAGTVAVLHVAESIDDIYEGLDALTGTLVVALPVLLAVLVLTAWWLVGRTLRPVAAAARRQDRFVSDASHELRSPLGRIRARLEVDLAHPDGADLGGSARAVLGEVAGMERLVDDLLHVARADAPGGASVQGPVDLDDLVLDEVRALRGGSIEIDASAVSGAQVRGDRDALVRLVRNLLDNAARHARGRIGLALSEEDGQVVLAVDDDGPGIPPGRRDEVFERFTRLDEARTPGDGRTGLGLAIVRDIADRHGGTVTVADAPLGGARLEVRLPRG